jgi:adenosylcobinamide kinase/adenosylcobinamide-phosphate guanylyltransferase
LQLARKLGWPNANPVAEQPVHGRPVAPQPEIDRPVAEQLVHGKPVAPQPEISWRKVFVATAEASDEEMAERIERHRRERDPDFETIEVPLALPDIFARIDADVVVVDCLSLWLSNLLMRGDSTDKILKHVTALIAALRNWPGCSILVTNEVGMGIVPMHPLGRAFRDVAGMAHQRLSRAADELYFAALGTILRLKPGPVELCTDADCDEGEESE